MIKHKWVNKQYSADPIMDKFQESLFKSTDLLINYPLKIPKIKDHDWDLEVLEEVIEDIQLPIHKLTALVRKEYLKTLEKTISCNYQNWMNITGNYEDDTISEDDVKKCAEAIELRAVKSCMVANLYRNFMLQVISQIRKETKNSILNNNIIELKTQPKNTREKGVQTEVPKRSHHSARSTHRTKKPANEQNYQSLDERLKFFEKRFQLKDSIDEPPKKMLKPKLQDKNRHSIETRTPPTPFMTPLSLTNADSVANLCSHLDDDKIMAELQEMFHTTEENNIFEECENQAQINAIISEIQKFDEPKTDCDMKEESVTPPMRRPLTPLTQGSDAKGPPKQTDLKKSIWPCEYHMQKIKLRNLLSIIMEENYKKYEKVKKKFVLIFGEYDECEDEDVLQPYSPTIDLSDEILMGSCTNRIAKWVVNALMKPLKDGLIANRFLFKKLAKMIAENIIYLDQYPDQKFINNYILDYFCAHTAIKSIEDIT